MRTLSLLPILLSCMAWGQTKLCGKDGCVIVAPSPIQVVDGPIAKPINTCPELVEALGGSPECGPKVPAGKACINYGPKPEPMDVPAIKHTPKLPKEDPNAPQFCTLIGDQRPSGICINGKVFNPSPRWTCVDKSRILLTDESGGKHCLKFPSGAKD